VIVIEADGIGLAPNVAETLQVVGVVTVDVPQLTATTGAGTAVTVTVVVAVPVTVPPVTVTFDVVVPVLAVEYVQTCVFVGAVVVKSIVPLPSQSHA